MNPQEVLTFWFKETSPAQKFQKDASFDQVIKDRFEATLIAAVKDELASWRKDIYGRLAEIIVLDQFSRNIYRDSPKAFSQDAKALDLAAAALQLNHQALNVEEKQFLYMPFMHSESLESHEIATKLFSQPGLEDVLKFEVAHKKIIQRFGRYPHRNQILGRASTPEEIEFLKQENSSF
ncbi:MAG: DUF924 domain-containing protein [Bdellovibrionales bacterium]|nr:DUF924 domain-containing protein [Bdellovibrionales bacterium]